MTGVTSTQVTANFNIPAGATLGAWDVYLSENDNGQNDTLYEAFEVQYRPRA